MWHQRRNPAQGGRPDARTIIAIDRDPDAPIREFADMLVVGDLFQIVPALTTALRERHSTGA